MNVLIQYQIEALVANPSEGRVGELMASWEQSAEANSGVFH